MEGDTSRGFAVVEEDFEGDAFRLFLPVVEPLVPAAGGVLGRLEPIRSEVRSEMICERNETRARNLVPMIEVKK